MTFGHWLKGGGLAVYSYRIAGLDVAGDVALPGAIDAPAATAPDVTICAGEVPQTLGGEVLRSTWEIAGERFLLRIPGIARFLIENGRTITYQSDGAPERDIAVFLLGTAFGILLHQRGRVVFHASAVAVGGRAVLFCGPSGAGKSTLAAALAKRGRPLVADDVCAISGGDGQPPLVHPDGRSLKLWGQALDKLGLGEARGEAVREQLEKYYVAPAQAHPAAMPAGAVYILRETRPPLASGIERVNLVDGALMLRRNAYRPLLVKQMARHMPAFHGLSAALIGGAGVYMLTRPMDFSAMDETLDGLEAHWADLGLAGRAA